MTTRSHKVLIVGSGGREFALAERFGADSLQLKYLWCLKSSDAATDQVCVFAG